MSSVLCGSDCTFVYIHSKPMNRDTHAVVTGAVCVVWLRLHITQPFSNQHACCSMQSVVMPFSLWT